MIKRKDLIVVTLIMLILLIFSTASFASRRKPTIAEEITIVAVFAPELLVLSWLCSGHLVNEKQIPKKQQEMSEEDLDIATVIFYLCGIIAIWIMGLWLGRHHGEPGESAADY